MHKVSINPKPEKVKKCNPKNTKKRFENSEILNNRPLRPSLFQALKLSDESRQLEIIPSIPCGILPVFSCLQRLPCVLCPSCCTSSFTPLFPLPSQLIQKPTFLRKSWPASRGFLLQTCGNQIMNPLEAESTVMESLAPANIVSRLMGLS